MNFIENDDGMVEINPEELFNNVIKVLRDAIDGKLKNHTYRALFAEETKRLLNV